MVRQESRCKNANRLGYCVGAGLEGAENSSQSCLGSNTNSKVTTLSKNNANSQKKNREQKMQSRVEQPTDRSTTLGQLEATGPTQRTLQNTEYDRAAKLHIPLTPMSLPSVETIPAPRAI